MRSQHAEDHLSRFTDLRRWRGQQGRTSYLQVLLGGQCVAGLGLQFVSVLPGLTPATDLGLVGAKGYARRAGLTSTRSWAVSDPARRPRTLETPCLSLPATVVPPALTWSPTPDSQRCPECHVVTTESCHEPRQRARTTAEGSTRSQDLGECVLAEQQRHIEFELAVENGRNRDVSNV